MISVGDTLHITHPSGDLEGVVLSVSGKRIDCVGFYVLDLGTHYEIHLTEGD